MNTERVKWNKFGTTLRYCAAGLRLRPELVLTYLSSLLGGLAGAFARMDGPLGVSCRPALPLVLAERHPSRARHLQQLAIEPATHFGDWQRRKAQVLDPALFSMRHSQIGAAVRQENLSLMDDLEANSFNQDRIAGSRTALFRHQQNYQPSVMICSPDPRTFDEARGSVADDAPLVVDTGGRLLRNAFQPHPKQREWQALLEVITEGARNGIDQPAGESGVSTLNAVRRTLTPFLMHLPIELSGQAILHPASANLFEVGVMLPTEAIKGRLTSTEDNFRSAQQAVNRYRKALDHVLWSRLDNSGVAFALTKPIPEWLDGHDEIHDKIDALPSTIRRSCGGLIDLPLRLLWTSLLLDDPKAKNVAKLVPGVLQTAHWCVDNQVTLITEALAVEQRRELEVEAGKMLRKLGQVSLPCKFASLAKKYHDQRREVLEPALRFLCDEGLVSWDEGNNQIELRPHEPSPEWLDSLMRAKGREKLILPTRFPASP